MEEGAAAAVVSIVTESDPELCVPVLPARSLSLTTRAWEPVARVERVMFLVVPLQVPVERSPATTV